MTLSPTARSLRSPTCAAKPAHTPRVQLGAKPRGRGEAAVPVRRLDRLLLSTVVVASCLALATYQRATHTLSLTPSFSTGRGGAVAYASVLGATPGEGAAGEQPGRRRQLSGGGAGVTSSGGGSGGGGRPRILLRYTACTGLMNQQYSHIAAFTLAAALRADILLPPAICRDSFEHYFSTNRTKNEMAWTPFPTEGLLDVGAIQDAWARAGITVHRAKQLTPYPDMSDPRTAFPTFAQQPGEDARAVARLEGIYLKPRSLGELTAMAWAAVETATLRLAAESGGGSGSGADTVVLDLPCTFFALRTDSVLPLVSKVAGSLAFNPHLRGVAARVVDAITGGGRRPFNGVHLRVEKDALDWVKIMRGKGSLWHLYIVAMREAGFNGSMPLFVASGLLTYSQGATSGDWLEAVEILTHRNLASEVHYKEEFVPDFELAGLNQEQRALIDFLVLARAQRFVGFGSSTFSYYLREYRALHYGLPHSTSLLLNTTRIGTDALFAAAGRVAAAGGEEGLGGAPAASGCTGLLRWLRLECWWGLHGGWR